MVDLESVQRYFGIARASHTGEDCILCDFGVERVKIQRTLLGHILKVLEIANLS